MAITKCLLLLAIVACAYASNFYNSGPCPTNRTVGERWTIAAKCTECYCDQTGYGCSGCGVPVPTIGCYITEDSKLAYPDCCPELYCPPVNV